MQLLPYAKTSAPHRWEMLCPQLQALRAKCSPIPSACLATGHMKRIRHADTVPGAADEYAQACKRRLARFGIETGGNVHRDMLQFVRDKLANAPVEVKASKTHTVAMTRNYARIAECLLERHHHTRCMDGLIMELGRRRCKRE